MQTKLYIDISQGVIHVEGDPQFVCEIYADFKSKLQNILENSAAALDRETNSTEKPSKKSRSRQKPPLKQKATIELGEKVVDPNKPKLDRELDLSRLSDFYGQYDPQSHPEKILIFTKYLADELNINQVNSDQIYTCYKTLRVKMPQAFAQGFRDTHRRGFINLDSYSDIQVSIMGENHFNDGIKRKGAE